MNATSNDSRSAITGQKPPPEQPIGDILTKHPFIKGMSPHQIRILADCAMHSHFDTNELILREGDPANRFYLIQKGSVVLEAHSPHDGVVPVQTLGAGDVLGWSWLFPPYFWHFNARALEPTEAIFFYGTPLREECECDHDLGYELMKRMTAIIERRLQATRGHLLASGGLTLEYRQAR